MSQVKARSRQGQSKVKESFFTRPRREPTFNEEKDFIFELILLKTNNLDQDETETRLSEIEAHETRPGRDCPKIFHPRRDRDKNSSKILYEAETRPRVSIPLVSRPRRDRDSCPSLHCKASKVERQGQDKINKVKAKQP